MNARTAPETQAAARKRFARSLRGILPAACVVGIAPSGASAQSGMSAAEAAQLYAAAGFPITNGQPANRCGRPARPRVTFVDINGDKRPEALFVDADTQCYAPSGRYFAILAKEGTSWRPVLSGAGAIQALPTQTGGWLDMHVTEADCTRNYRFGGRAYAAATDCSGGAAAAAPPPAKAAAAPLARGASTSALQAADEAAAFRAAGFTKRKGVWRSDCDDPGTATYSPGAIDKVVDLNGDGRPEVMLTEGGTYCYGNAGQGFWLLSRLVDGGWKVMARGTGIPEFLKTKGADGWPDISVGGPGFCFPVERWNGREYKLQRWEYEGKACKPPR
jgi:hypothetical protein